MENFEVTKSTNSDFNELLIKNKINGEYISVLSERGARLNAAYLKSGEKYFNVLKSVKSKDLSLPEELFNNAKLFPFANRIKDGTYIFNNNSYKFDITFEEENNACHGILFDEEFDIGEENITEDYAEVSFNYTSDGLNEAYPFMYFLSIKYKLTIEGKVRVETYLKNLSGNNMPVAEGWHPYFAVPGIADDFELIIPAEKAVMLDEFNIPNGSLESINGQSGLKVNLNNKSMDNCYLVKKNGNKVNTILYNTDMEFVLTVWQETGEKKYNFIQIYIPPSRDSVAIEPMTSNINAFNNKDHLIVLRPGEGWNASYGFYLTNKYSGKNE